MLTPRYKEICKERIKKYEGFSLQPYKDSKGIWTGGWGHKLDNETKPLQYTQEYWEKVFEDDYNNVIRQLQGDALFNSLNLSQSRQIVLIDMCFNMGHKSLDEFNDMWAALAKDDFKLSAKQILFSDYALDVGYRAMDNAKAMWKDKL